MLRTAEIERYQNFACPRPAGGARAALALTLVLHVVVIGALAAITVSIATTPPAPRGEIEAAFAPAPPVPGPTPALENFARQRPRFDPTATPPQLRALPDAPVEVVIIAEVERPTIEAEIRPKFDREFLPESDLPPTRTKSQRTASPAGERPAKTSSAPAQPAKFTQAQVRSTSRPSYPESARRKGHQGTAQVRLELDAAGEVTAANLSKSSGSAALDASALKAARRWKFKPAMSGGRAIASKIIVPIRFHLD